MKKKLIAYFQVIQTPMLYKDTFLIPYYISKKLGLDMEFWANENQSGSGLPSSHRGVKLNVGAEKKVTKYNILKTLFYSIILRYKQVDAIFFVNGSPIQYLVIIIMRIIKPKLKIVIMGDYEPELAKEILSTSFWTDGCGIKGKLKKILLSMALKPSVLCIAQPQSYKLVRTLYDKWGWNNIVFMYPCLDDEALRDSGIKLNDVDAKENMFLYVGRIGNYQKNTDMLLEALSKVDMKDWKFYLIGSITDSFRTDTESNYKETIDNFFKIHPEKKNNVIFTGPIYDTNMIFDYYNRAKIFVLTSRHESFANVLSEAAAFGCYFLSTDVGGATFVTHSWKYGIKLEQEDSDGLANAMNRIINGSIEIDPSNRLPRHELLYSEKIDDIIRCFNSN